MSPRDILTRPAPPPDATVRYGDLPDQVADVRGAGHQTLVLLHGGFWRPQYDRAHLGTLSAALAAEGFTVYTPEYRRTGWPGMFDDVAAFLDGLTGDPVLIGHSAGGHLALWAAVRHNLPADCRWHTSRRPAGVISLAGCSSLANTDAWGLDVDAAAVMMGGSAADLPDRYALADPAALLPLDVPVTLIHGDRDGRVPIAMSEQFAAASGARLIVLGGIEHYALIDPADPVTWPVLRSLLTGQVTL
jgi:pimeloyl-ACP methyl ester carboxylesterase